MDLLGLPAHDGGILVGLEKTVKGDINQNDSMNKRGFSLLDLLNEELTLNIVDVGASKLEGDSDPVYKNLLTTGLTKLIGFEPNTHALNDLNKTKSANETYLPYALGDGRKHTLNICQAWGMSSILEPNFELLNHFHGFPEWAKITKKIEVETKRLDDVDEISNVDFIKLDVQGAELMILENATKTLEKCLAIHTEVEFLEMYKNQPLFSEIELFLRKQGFTLHNFHNIDRRMVSPLANPNNQYDGINQVLYADAVFIKDFTRLNNFSKEELMKLAVILHDIYQSFDVALRVLIHSDKAFETNLSNKYIEFITKSGSVKSN